MTGSVSGAHVSRFSDVSADNPYLTGIEYAADHGFCGGIGNGLFGSGQNVKASQVIMMLCRLKAPDAIPAGNIGFSTAYWACVDLGWFGNVEILEDGPIRRGQFYELLFNAFGVDAFSPSLYDDSLESVGIWDSTVYAVKSFGLCDESAKPSDIMSRDEAVWIIAQFAQNDYELDPPPILSEWKIDNPQDRPVGEYLLELSHIPDSVHDKFEEKRFTYSLDKTVLDNYNKTHDGLSVGLFTPGKKTIHVSDPFATLHEFGHFVDYCLDYPSKQFASEMKSGRAFLPAYSGTNAGEYYAEYFAYFLEHGDDPGCIRTMKEHTPLTYEHFSELAGNDWCLDEAD